MAAIALHELNQLHVRASDRARSLWTFYQFLQAVFKHLADTECPAELDFQTLFARLREVAEQLGHADASRATRALGEIEKTLDHLARELFVADREVSPSLLRRFFDRLRRQDERVLQAVIKFYLQAPDPSEDILDKLDILLTRLAEIPREDGGSRVRERHEIERLVQPLLAARPIPATTDAELHELGHTLGELRSEVLGLPELSALLASDALDRFRALKRRLKDSLLDPRILPAIVDTTVTIKNRFRELWEDEEPQLLDDTNRVMELRRHFLAHPEILTAELRDALDGFSSLHKRFDQARKDDNLRREDILELRRSLTTILEHHDAAQRRAAHAARERAEDTKVIVQGTPVARAAEPVPQIEESSAPHVPADPLLAEYFSKIIYALELVGADRPAAELVHARELATLHLEPWEVDSCLHVSRRRDAANSLDDQRHQLFFQAAALRIRMDEEAREVIRLDRRGSEKLHDILDGATQSLQRAADLDRRFQWFIEDALYRGDTEHLEKLYRSRFRLLRAYSGVWLIHNERGGISPF